MKSKTTESKLATRVKTELLEKIEGTMEKEEISQGEVARRIGGYRYNVNKVMRQKMSASIELMLKIAEALGLDVELKIKRLKD